MSFQRKLLFALLVGLIPLVALGITGYWLIDSSTDDSARDRTAQLASSRAQSVSAQLDVALRETAGVAEWGDLIDPVRGMIAGDQDRQQAGARLAHALTWWGGFRSLTVLGPDTETIVATDHDALTRIRRDPDPGAEPIVGEWGAPGRSEAFQVAARLGDSGAVLIAEIDLDVLRNVLAGGDDHRVQLANVGAGTTLELVDGAPALGSAQTSIELDAALEEPYTTNVDGLGTAVVATAEVARSPWTVVVAQTVPDGSAARTALVALVVAALVLVAVAAVVSLGLGGSVSRRIERITAAATAIGDGDFEHRVGRLGDDELGELSASFDGMAEMLVTDISRRREMETLLVQQTLHDPLTGLANRAKLVDRLGESLVVRDGTARTIGLLFCDLDGFKAVNDQYGHSTGDELLLLVADRFRASVRPSDTVARFGGDEFVVLCPDLGSVDDALGVADRLRIAFSDPFEIGGHELLTTTSIGIAVGQAGSVAPDDLLRMADHAMYEAKEGGKARNVVYEGSDLLDEDRRSERLREVRRALEGGELELHHQPIIDLRDSAVVGLESYVRWNHPSRGQLRPRDLLDLAASVGVAADVDLWVLERACREICGPGRGSDAYGAWVSVNLTPGSLASEDFARRVAATLAKVDCRPDEIVFEVSEASLSGDPAMVLGTLDELHELGVGLMIDDFGTGHSSLDRLQRCPVDAIKIHQTLVHGVVADEDDRAAVRAILSMAEALELDVIAEGIETSEQRHALRELGCRQGQGYHLGRPVPVHELPQEPVVAD